MSIFLGRQCAFVFPIYVQKYRKYTIDRCIVVYTVCASAVISPLNSGWIPTLKLVWKYVTRPSILFICNTVCCLIILLSSLYIELALVCCTNPDNVHCFETIFLNVNLVFFASIGAARPVHIQSDQYRSCSTVKQLSFRCGATKNSAVALNLRNDMISIHQRSARRMKTKQCWFKVTRELCHEWFHHVRHHVHDGHLGWRIRRSHLTSTLFPWWRPRRIRPERPRLNWRTPQWARGQFTRTIIPDWFDKWRDLKFC